MNRVLVTGGAGYIGSKIVSDLINKGYKVFIIDNLSTGYKLLINKKAKFFNENICYKNKVKKIISNNQIDTIIHCAASIDVLEGEKNKKKYYNNNVRNTEILLKSIEGTKVKNFIFSSTCAVYGGRKKIVSETSDLQPQNFYGKTKYKSENLIKRYSKKYNFNYVLLRYFNVAGSDLKNKIGCINKTNSLFKNLSINVNKKKFEIDIYGNDYETVDGTCIRDFIHVSDISKLHLLSLKKLINTRKSEIYNCGYGKGYSVYQVVKKFEKLINHKIKINFLSRRSGDIEQLYSDNNKIKKSLNFKVPRNNLENIIKSSIEWEKIIN